MDGNLPTKEDMRNAGLALAAKLVLKKRYNEAKKTLTATLELCPNDLEILTLLANVNIIEGKIKDAKRWLDKVFLIDPNYPRALYQLGVLFGENGEWERAVKLYERAIMHFPVTERDRIADAYQNLGCALWEVRRRDDALDAWKTCLEYDPDNKRAKCNLEEFTNEYGMPKSPAQGMDDIWAFIEMKMQEYRDLHGENSLNKMSKANVILGKITAVWNEQIASKYGKKLDDMSTEEKIELFKKTKVFD
jgi:tetratricopeptide (TPR) repeat protein